VRFSCLSLLAYLQLITFCQHEQRSADAEGKAVSAVKNSDYPDEVSIALWRNSTQSLSQSRFFLQAAPYYSQLSAWATTVLSSGSLTQLEVSRCHYVNSITVEHSTKNRSLFCRYLHQYFLVAAEMNSAIARSKKLPQSEVRLPSQPLAPLLSAISTALARSSSSYLCPPCNMFIYLSILRFPLPEFLEREFPRVFDSAVISVNSNQSFSPQVVALASNVTSEYGHLGKRVLDSLAIPAAKRAHLGTDFNFYLLDSFLIDINLTMWSN
jgi:hypothetical protein